MATKTPVNTAPPDENPELTNLKQKEKNLTAKLERLENSDADKQSSGIRIDLADVKRRTEERLNEVRANIALLSKTKK